MRKSLDAWPNPLAGDTACAKCNKRPATDWWAGDGGMIGAVHGCVAPWCKVCCLEEQLTYARNAAQRIPELEAELAALKGEPDGKED